MPFQDFYTIFILLFGIIPSLYRTFKTRIASIKAPTIRVFVNGETETIWESGISWVMFLAVLFGVIELFFLLPKFALLFQDVTPEGLRTIGFVLIYLFLFLLGLFGNISSLTKPKLTLSALGKGIAGGFIVFFILLILNYFMSGLTLFQMLEAPSPPQFTSVFEKAMYQISFVAIGEELVFRQSLPFWFTQALNIKLSKTTSVSIAFVISNVLFGVVHFVAYGFNVIPMIFAIVAGFAFTVAKFQFGNLANVLAHLFFNLAVLSQLFIGHF